MIIISCQKNNITAYEIGKATGLNPSGVQRILNKEVKKPHRKTLQKIKDFIETRITGTAKKVENKIVFKGAAEEEATYNGPLEEAIMKAVMKRLEPRLKELNEKLTNLRQDVKTIHDQQMEMMKEQKKANRSSKSS